MGIDFRGLDVARALIEHGRRTSDQLKKIVSPKEHRLPTYVYDCRKYLGCKISRERRNGITHYILKNADEMRAKHCQKLGLDFRAALMRSKLQRNSSELAEEAPAFIRTKVETATVTAKGQVTVPKRIREYLSLTAGDEVFYTIESGVVVMRARNVPIQQLKTILPRPSKSASLGEIEETIRKSRAGE